LIALIIDAHRSAAARTACAMRVVDRKTICFEHTREHGGQAVSTTGARLSSR